MNKTLTLALVLAAVAGTIFFMAPRRSTNLKRHILNFKDWKHQHNKTYETAEEEQLRFQIFQDNLEFIIASNQDSESEVEFGLNQFADLTIEEFQTKHLNLPPVKPANAILHKPTLKDTPKSINWVTKGAVTPVKNQGQTGSAFAYAAVGALEGASFVYQKKIAALSAAEISDCVKGSLISGAVFDFTMKNGIQTAESYGASTGACKADVSKAFYRNTGTKAVPKNDNDALKEAVAQQPVMVGIDGRAMMFYKSGVLRAKDCTQNVSHAVLAVGYDTANGVDYWLVKNSWGTSWGEQGYARVERTTGKQGGACGISSFAFYPTGAQH